MPTSTRLGIRYPAGTDVPDVPLWMSRMAADLDNAATTSQGLYAARPTSTPGSPGVVGRRYTIMGEAGVNAALNGIEFYDTGTGWQIIAHPVSRVTALPTTVFDGLTVDFVADITNSVIWRLKYNASSASAYKWEYAGGSELYSSITVTSGQTGNAGYQDKNGPYITLPFAGDFTVAIAFEGNSNAGQQLVQSYALGTVNGGITVLAPPDSVERNLMYVAATAAQDARPTKWSKVTNPAAGNVLSAMYKTIGASGGNFTFRSLHVRPIRVG